MTLPAAASLATSPQAPSRPAWREPLVWLVFGIPGLTVVAGLATWWFAAQRADSNVADDWYKQGLAINRSLEREARAADRQVRGTLTLEPGHRLRLALNATGPLPAQITLRLIHPVQAAQDQTWQLIRGPHGLYEVIDPRIAPGPWGLTLEAQDWRIHVRQLMLSEHGVVLEPRTAPR